MRIAVTGSSGLIGKALTDHLSSAGHTLIALVRHEGQAMDDEHCWWHPELGIRQPEKLKQIDAVIHLAGRSIADHRWTEKEKSLIRHSRVEATTRLCDDLIQLNQPPAIFLSASAVGIYGECGSDPVNESHWHGHGFLAETAVDWEAAAEMLLAAGTRVIHARFGIVLSAEGGALAKMLSLFRWGLGSNLGSGKQYWSWITLTDAVNALEWLMQEPSAAGAYNIVAPSPVTNAEFTRLLARAVHRPRFVPVPAIALRMLVGDMADEALLASCRAVPQRLLSGGFNFSAPTLADAWRQLL